MTECCFRVSFTEFGDTAGMNNAHFVITIAQEHDPASQGAPAVLAIFRLVLQRHGTVWRSLLGLSPQICHKADNSDACDAGYERSKLNAAFAWGPLLYKNSDRQDRKRDSRSDE